MPLLPKRFIDNPFLIIDFGSTKLRILELAPPPDDAEEKQVEKRAKLFKIIDFPNFSQDISTEEREGMSKAAYEEKLDDMRNKFINKQLTEIIFESKIETKFVVSILSDRSISSKYLEVKKVKPEEQAAAVEKEAFRQMPFALEDAKSAYRVLGEVIKEGVLYICVQFIIMPDVVIKRRLSLLKSLDLKPEALLTMATVLEQGLHPLITPPESEKGEEKPNTAGDEEPAEDLFRTVVVHIGYELSSVTIFEKGKFVFSRDITLGGESVNQSVLKAIDESIEDDSQENIKLTFDEIEAFKRELGVLPEDYIDEISGDKAEEKKFIARKTFEVTEKLLSNIQLSITYYLTSQGIPEDLEVIPVKKIILSGGGSRLKNLSDFIEGSMEIPVETLDPYKEVLTGEVEFNKEDEKESLLPLVGASKFEWDDEILDFWHVMSPRRTSVAGAAAAGAITDFIEKVKAFINEKMGKKEGDDAKKEDVSFSRSEWTEQDMQKAFGAMGALIVGIFLLFLGMAYKGSKDHKAEYKRLKKKLFKTKRKNSRAISAQNKVKKMRAQKVAMNKFSRKTFPWSQVLFEFSRVHNPSLHLSNIDFTLSEKNGVKALSFSISLQAKTKEHLFNYMDTLEKSPYFGDIDFGKGSYRLTNISKDENRLQEIYEASVVGKVVANLYLENKKYLTVIKQSIESRKKNYGALSGSQVSPTLETSIGNKDEDSSVASPSKTIKGNKVKPEKSSS